MKKNILLTIFIIIFIKNINIIIQTVKTTTILFFNNIFITLFPFMILSEILLYYDYHIFLTNTKLGKQLSKIFNKNKLVTTIFIFSMFSSNPNNAAFIKNLLDKKQINEKDATNILCYTYFPSISFTIATIGILTFNNIKIGILLYLNTILNNILIAIYLKKEIITQTNETTLNKDTLLNTIKNSTLKSINNLYVILTTIIIFTVIINLLKKTLNKKNNLLLLITPILELSTTINIINQINLNLYLKILIASFSLNFSGLSILFQSFGILSNYKINIKKILIIKLIFSLITSIILIPSLHIILGFD